MNDIKKILKIKIFKYKMMKYLVLNNIEKKYIVYIRKKIKKFFNHLEIE